MFSCQNVSFDPPAADPDLGEPLDPDGHWREYMAEDVMEKELTITEMISFIITETPLAV